MEETNGLGAITEIKPFQNWTANANINNRSLKEYYFSYKIKRNQSFKTIDIYFIFFIFDTK